MRKLLTFLMALGAIVFAVVSPVSANGVLFLAQSSAPAYVGPGDIQTFGIWGSAAFTFNAASASSSTLLADLVATGRANQNRIGKLSKHFSEPIPWSAVVLVELHACKSETGEFKKYF